MHQQIGHSVCHNYGVLHIQISRNPRALSRNSILCLRQGMGGGACYIFPMSHHAMPASVFFASHEY